MKKITLLLLALCISFVSYAQYLTEGFEGGTTIPPAGWTHTQTNANETWTINTTTANTGTNSAQVVYDAALGLQDETLTSPVIDLTGATNPQVTFFVNMSYYWAVDPNDNYDAIVSVFDGTTTTQIWEEADLGVFTSFTWYEVTLDLTAYAGNSNIQLLFSYVGSDGASLNIDDILVEEAPSCFVPENFVAGAITSNSFEIDWTDTNTGTPTWEIEWGVDGFTQGAGTMVTGLTTTTYTFPGLTADTAYEFYIRTNCGGAEGESTWVGPIGFESAYDCSLYGFPFSEDFANQNAYASCYTVEDTNADDTTWGYNNGNDFDGDTIADPVALIFPPDPTVAKDDWLFLPVFNGVANAEYELTIVYNVFDNPIAGSESFDIVALDSPSSTAVTQTVVGSYNSITQAGAGVADLLPNAYTSSASYTPTSDGDFYFAIHATTPEATSAIFAVFGLNVSETLGVNDFEHNNFSYNYNKVSKTLNLESSNTALSSVDIYSLLGQNVISRRLDNVTEAIDVSSINDGVYLAKVTINGNTKTIKFVKN
jgi:hypothetical protein